jgi:hypothetical protein
MRKGEIYDDNNEDKILLKAQSSSEVGVQVSLHVLSVPIWLRLLVAKVVPLKVVGEVMSPRVFELSY